MDTGELDLVPGEGADDARLAEWVGKRLALLPQIRRERLRQAHPRPHAGPGRRGRKGRGGGRRDAAGLQAVGVCKPRVPLPPAEPGHRAVPPWLDGPRDLAENAPGATGASRAAADAQLVLYRHVDAVAAAVGRGATAADLAAAYGVAVEHAARFILVNLTPI